MKKGVLLEKSREFAVTIVKLSLFLEQQKSFAIAHQVIKCGTSIGANIHEAQDAQSKKDFISKLNIALKESRETEYWLYIITESELVSTEKTTDISDALAEIISMLVCAIKTTKQKYPSEL